MSCLGVAGKYKLKIIMYDITTIGDCAEDIFVCPLADHFSRDQIGLRGENLYLRHGDKITAQEMYFDIGGGAANVAVGVSRLDLNSSVISIIGADKQSEAIIERFNKEKVDIANLKIDQKAKTNTSVVIVYKGERTIFVYRGKKDYSKLKLSKSLKTKWLYLAPVSQEFCINYPKIISLSCEKNINLAINPGSRQILQGKDEFLKLLRVAKLLILNKREAIEFTKLPKYADIKRMLMTITQYGPKIVIITDGSGGAYLSSGEEYWRVNAIKTQALDPTGAGDAFSSGFLASYIKSNDIKEALLYGMANSAMIIEEFGAQSNLQNESQIKKLLTHPPKLYKI